MIDNYVTNAQGNEPDAEQLRRLLENAIEATEKKKPLDMELLPLAKR